MSDLLPCPFCGHDDQLYPAHHFPGTGPAYAIDCLRCGMDFTPREGMDVAAAWNRRASQAEIEKLRTLVSECVKQLDMIIERGEPTDFIQWRAELADALSGSKE